MGQTQSSTTYTSKGGAEPGKRYRDLANKDGDKRKELSQRSQEAWNRNERAKAKELSVAAKALFESCSRYNELAVAEIFAANNPGYLSTPAPSLLGSLFSFFTASESAQGSLARIDLHGLRVQEALDKTKAHLVLCRKHGVKRTLIITGRGLHSIDGIAKIKPQVKQLLVEERVKIIQDKGANEGAFMVELAGEGEQAPVGGWGSWVRGLFE